MIRPGGVPQARHTFRTSLSEGGPINTKHALEPLRPSARGPVSSRPWVSDSLVLLQVLRNDILTQFTVRRKAAPREHAMKPGQVDSRVGH